MNRLDLIEQAVVHERGGSWAAAAELYERAFRNAAGSLLPAGMADVARRLGHCYRLAGQSELATEYFELSVTLAELLGEDALMGRALNGLGILQREVGDIDRAERIHARAQELGRSSGDEMLLGEVRQNLGITANIRGDLDEAMRHSFAALQHLERAGSDRNCMGVLNNLGMLHVDMGRLVEADQYFAQALAYSERLGDVVATAAIHVNRTELFLARGDYDRARLSCDEGYEIACRLGDVVRQAEAFKYYGIIYREIGKPHLSENHLRQAVANATGRDPLLEAESQRELALVLRAQQRNREALEALNRAHLLFRQINAARDDADVERKISDLEDDFLSLVRFWGETIEAKDRYTSGHCERVADYACLIAREAGLSDWELTWFRMGAFLHDVGKMEVPAEILNKPGRLTPEERAVMERHPLAGDEMLASVEFPWDVRAMVRSHHERWDGTGYPDRLAAETIPMAARILRIADIFDALTTVRSYRRSLTPEQALQMMEDDLAGFDPSLFGIFRELFPRIAERARAAQARAEAELAQAPAADPVEA
jgi:putative nucleotidyltransferase with HDIG domain